jgi:hypothetical protein
MQEHLLTAGTVRPVETSVTRRASQAYSQLLPLAAAALVAVLVAGWLLVHRDGDGGERAVAATGPTLVTPGELERFAAGAGQPVYWAGPRHGYVYELTATPGGRIFVRYLPEGFAAGDVRANFLTVGTYRAAHAYDDLAHAALRAGADSLRIDGGGIVVSSLRAPASAYLAYPDSDYQVEVYNPAPGHSLRLLRSGAIQPVG